MGAASSTPPAKGSKTALLVLGSLLAVVILGAVVYFATRTSKEYEALQAVCSARADIKTRVNDLASTTVTTFTLEGFKENVGGITNDVSIIRAAQAELKPNRKAEIKAANQQFESAITTTLKGLGSGLSAENAEDKLKSAGQELVSTYKATLEPVDCNGVDIDN
jgi:uncharacterized protein HemX